MGQNMRWPIKSRKLRWLFTTVLFCGGVYTVATGRIVKRYWTDTPPVVTEGPIAYGFGILWIAISFYWAMRLRKEKRDEVIVQGTKKPNKAPEPTSGTVTPPAEPGVAPVPPVAHL